MQLRLPRRPRASAAHEPARDAEPVTLPADDPWAGEDDPWTGSGDLAREAPDDFIRFFRGAVIGVVLGLGLWAVIVLVAVLVLG
jgi:hypothetical protein